MIFQKAPDENKLVPGPAAFAASHQQPGAYPPQSNDPIATRRSLPSSFGASYDRPVQSIEWDDNILPAPTQHSKAPHSPYEQLAPHAPTQGHSRDSQRSNDNLGLQPHRRLWPDHGVIDLTMSDRPQRSMPQHQSGYQPHPEIVDLTQPQGFNRPAFVTPPMAAHAMLMSYGAQNSYVPNNDSHAGHEAHTTAQRLPNYYSDQLPADLAPYNPHEPLLHPHELDRRRQEHRDPAPQFQTPSYSEMPPKHQHQPLPLQFDGTSDYRVTAPAPALPGYLNQPPQFRAMPQGLQPIYNQSPQPVHGAPAPVQQILRNPYAFHDQHAVTYGVQMPPSQPPMNGSPHPTQMFQPR